MTFTLLSFEKTAAFRGAGTEQRKDLRRSLAAAAIDWRCLRYHQRPSLPATVFDVFNGIRVARRIIKHKQIELVHARSHIPATMALALKRQFGVKLILTFAWLYGRIWDADHWQAGSVRIA
jgi:hypothetical protein